MHSNVNKKVQSITEKDIDKSIAKNAQQNIVSDLNVLNGN